MPLCTEFAACVQKGVQGQCIVLFLFQARQSHSCSPVLCHCWLQFLRAWGAPSDLFAVLVRPNNAAEEAAVGAVVAAFK